MQRDIDPDDLLLTPEVPTAVTFDRVRVQYGDVVALDIETLQLRPGLTGLVGVNGAGKTSLMRTLVGLVRPQSGQVLIHGEALTARSARRALRLIGLAPQQFRAPGNITAHDLVAYLGWLHGLSPAAATSRATTVLNELGLADREQTRMRELSGGMVRRVAIAQAMVHDPPLLLLDEPTAGLDPEQRAAVRDVVARAAHGRTAIVSSHLLEDVVRWSDNILVLDAGRVAFHGTVDEFWAAAARLGVSEHDGELAFLAVIHRRG